MTKRLALTLTVSLLAFGACRGEDPAAQDVQPLPPPGADVGAAGTDATATVIAEDDSLVRNAHP